MQDLSWQESYAIGYGKVDKEHQKLFKIAGQAFKAVQSHEKVTKIKTIIRELIDYTKVHFMHEERYMEQIGYPHLNEHKQIHHNMILSMNTFLKTVNLKNINELEKELAHFIEQWFIAHIVYEDKKISAWSKGKEIKIETAWTSSYKIGNPLIDSEHQELFSLANDASQMLVNQDKRESIRNTVAKLYEYVQKHFKNEEEYMLSLKYNNLEEHQVLHVNILKQLNNLVKNSISLKLEEISDQLNEFIEKGLIEHIIKEDKKITLWIQFLEDLKVAQELKEIE